MVTFPTWKRIICSQIKVRLKSKWPFTLTNRLWTLGPFYNNHFKKKRTGTIADHAKPFNANILQVKRNSCHLLPILDHISFEKLHKIPSLTKVFFSNLIKKAVASLIEQFFISIYYHFAQLKIGSGRINCYLRIWSPIGLPSTYQWTEWQSKFLSSLLHWWAFYLSKYTQKQKVLQDIMCLNDVNCK